MTFCSGAVTATCLHLDAACGATLSTPTEVNYWDCSCPSAEVDRQYQVEDVDHPHHLPHALQPLAAQHLLCAVQCYLTSVAGLKLVRKPFE